MLVKQELKKIPPCGFDALTETAVKDNKFHYYAAAKIVKLERSGTILVVDYYDTIHKNLQVRFFVSKKQRRYITYLPADDSWNGKSLLNNLYECSMQNASSYQMFKNIDSSDKCKCYCTSKNCASVSKYLQKSDNYYSYKFWVSINGITAIIENFCQCLRDEKSKKELEKKDKIDNLFNSLFEIEYSKNIDEWVDKNLLPQYIVYSKLSKDHTRNARCTHCGKVFKIESPIKQGQRCICPHCNSKAIYYPNWHIESRVDKVKIMVANRVKDFITYEISTAYRSFIVDRRSNGVTACSYYDPSVRTVYVPEKNTYMSSTYAYMPYYWGAHWSRYKKWIPTREDCIYTYPCNLDIVLDNRYSRYQLKQRLTDYNGKINLLRLISNIDTIPQSEYLIKMGLIGFVADDDFIRYSNAKAFSFKTLTGCSRQYLPLFKEMNVTPSEADIISASKEFVSAELFSRFRLLRNLSPYTWSNDRLKTCLEYMSLTKLLNYYEKQKSIAEGIDKEESQDNCDIITALSDYISMNKQMGVNLNRKNLFPADIISAHDKIVERYNIVKKDIEEKASTAALKIVNDFFTGYEKDGLTVQVPRSRQDFIREGTELSHCVGSDRYYQNHIKGKYMIFFIRKSEEPDIAYYTCEIDMCDFKVLQLYGYGDCIAPKNIKKFANEFAKWLSKKSFKLQKAG